MKISGAIKEVEAAAPSVINILAYVGIGALVVGVISYIAVTGSVSLPATLGTFLNTTIPTNAVTALTAVITVLVTIISLLVVSALWRLFGLGGKGKGGNSM